MRELLSSSYNFLQKLLPEIKSTDLSTKSESDDDSSSLWTQFWNSDPIFQAFIILTILFGLFWYLCLPVLQDFFLAEKCRFQLLNIETLKPGESGFLPSFALTEAEAEKLTQSFFNALIIKVLFKGEPVVVPVMKAYAEEDYGTVKIIFPVDKSGTYVMTLRYNGFLIPGCPVGIHVPPESMCAESTEVKLPSMPVLLTDGMPQTLEIFPNDITGYPCSIDGVTLDKFDFHASTERSCCNARLCGKVCELIGGYWKEGLDADFTYGSGNPNSRSNDGSGIAVFLTLRTNRSPNSYGVFEGQICYSGHIVKCFPIVSLSPEEYERLEPTLKQAKPTDVIQLKAEMLEPVVVCDDKSVPKGFIDRYCRPQQEGGTTEKKIKEVHLNVSLKFICVKEVVWTVLLSRTALFSIQGGTKIEAVPETDEKERYIVKISDDTTNNEIRLFMSASSTRMLMALFLKFRYSLTTSELTFPEKAGNFYAMLDSHCKRLVPFHPGNFELLMVSRPDLLRTSHEATKTFDKAQWSNPFVVSFIQEPLLEDDGAWLEWADLVLDTVLENNPNGMFHKISERSGFIHPNPLRNYRRWSIQYYELSGKLVGKYLVERARNLKSLNFRVKARFSRSFLLQLIGTDPTGNSLERDLPEVYESTLQTLTKSNFENGALTFCVPLYDSYGKLDQMIPLMENGEQVLVTNDNADIYLNALANYHLVRSVRREIAAFRAGFTFVVPEDLLLNFDENELELLICGWSKLDIEDMKRNHEAVGQNWHPEFVRVIKWFWTCLSNMSEVDQAQFLQFSIGSSILPLGGFAQLNPQLTISMTCLYGQLPVADPSTHKICLSDHPDQDEFNSAMLSAIRRSPCCQDKPKNIEFECVHAAADQVVKNNTNSHDDLLIITDQSTNNEVNEE